MPLSTIDPATFRSVLGRFASGVTVVTVRDVQHYDHGMTVTAFCSVSLEPPLVQVSIGKAASLHGVLGTGNLASQFAVNILSSKQEPLARRFAEEHPDRFDGVGFTRGVTGAPILDECLDVIECEVQSRYEAGDHTIVIGTVIGTATNEGSPLLYYRGGYASLQR
ncbi:MAG: flavin reductase family protein [Gemmatimonadaceae bacterium]|nr:flavin reductase family protein [Gemmatimonadaceae bacterium]